MFKKYGQQIFIITAVAVLLVIIVSIGFITLSSDPKTEPTSSPAPTLIPYSGKTNPPIKYQPKATQKMIDKLVSRTPLSNSDKIAKERILNLFPAGQVSGVIYKSPTIQVEYINAADEIQVEILTVDIAQAKTDASSWFSSHGFSKEAICNLPVVFYINRNIANQLRNSNIQFSPLAEGC